MKKTTFYNHDNEIQKLMEGTPTPSDRTEVKNFKQEQIQLLILEVKRTTKIIESFNETLFRKDWHNENERSNHLSR